MRRLHIKEKRTHNKFNSIVFQIITYIYYYVLFKKKKLEI